MSKEALRAPKKGRMGSGMMTEPHYTTGPVVQHNWVAISVVRNGTPAIVDDVPSGPCTVYLDPWMANGPGVFPSDGDHSQHNCVMHWVIGPDDEPTGAHYTCIPSEENHGVTHQITCDGWTW